MNAPISLKPFGSETKSSIWAIDKALPWEPRGADAFGAPSKKNATGTCRMWEICCNRLAPMRLAPFSYFCTCWNVRGFIAHEHESFYDALFDGLREYGYEEGRNLIVERRYARGRADRFKEFAAEMVRLNVDIIIVVTTPAALAVMNATKTIPIVHPNAIDPLNTR